MVGAGRHEVGAVHLDAEPVVGQAVDGGEARDAPRPAHGEPRHAPEQVGAVAGDGLACRQIRGARPGGAEGTGQADLDRIEEDLPLDGLCRRG